MNYMQCVRRARVFVYVCTRIDECVCLCVWTRISGCVCVSIQLGKQIAVLTGDKYFALNYHDEVWFFLNHPTVSMFVCLLVGALSPVNHKGLHQGWTQTSFYFQVCHFTSHHTTKSGFSAYLYSAGTQHGNLHPAGWPILFCRPTQEPCVSHSQHREKSGEVLEKMQVNGPEV